ncbi:hypothetical protein ANMWB30_24570 [Arthrobacter sp. MWB30]|nr:hypothetical protein ANMWB30_24570 [Arthrobacter sp. MWB30]
MSTKLETVAQEIATALNTFTTEGFAEEIGFRADDSGSSATAEVYDPATGDVAETFNISFTITPSGAHVPQESTETTDRL